MSILSEKEIREKVREKLLIKDGREQDVRGSSYACHAAKVMPGGPGESGSQPEHYDWSKQGAAASSGVQLCRIAPRQVVWVRIKETVRLPNDICAFWWQTNSLSRKGLMLVNMSMVDPGYEGSLACLFVNFGREPVDIDPTMTIARLVFQKVDGENPAYTQLEDQETYDRNLREVALHGASSFLSFQEFETTFTGEKDKALQEFTKAKDDAISSMKSEIANEVRAQFMQHTQNLPKFLMGSYVFAFGGFVLLTAALAISPWIAQKLAPETTKEIAAAVDANLGSRVQPTAATTTSSIADLEKRVHDLEAALHSVQQAPSAARSTAAPEVSVPR